MTFFLPGTEKEIPCPVGTYNPSLGIGDVLECKMCDAGSYCREESINPTGLCNAGYYCPTNITNEVASLRIGSYGPEQIPCPKGTYRNATGGRFEADCSPCTIGNYCPIGTVIPKVCPLGFYCPPASGDPQPCPVGTFNNRSGIYYIENCTACTPGW